jgi:WD40 repeat protein
MTMHKSAMVVLASLAMVFAPSAAADVPGLAPFVGSWHPHEEGLNQIPTTSLDGTLRLWRAVLGQAMRGSEPVVGQVAFSPDGRRIVASSDTGLATVGPQFRCGACAADARRRGQILRLRQGWSDLLCIMGHSSGVVLEHFRPQIGVSVAGLGRTICFSDR